MTRLGIASIVLVLAGLASQSGAATSADSTVAPARSQAGLAAGKTIADSAAARPRSRTGAAPRRLEDITIEGEIPVPQVLFITARDQRRFMDFQHRRYLKTSLQIGQEAVLPSWIGVSTKQPARPATETSP
jgi:hypothetical protein